MELLKITRSVVFQELPKSRYVEGDSGQDVTQNVHRHEYGDEEQVQLPYASTNKGHVPMDVDLIDTRPISVPSDFDTIRLTSYISGFSDPPFEIAEVYKETINVDVNTEQTIALRGGLNQINDSSDLVPYRYGGHNAPIVLIPSQN